MRIACVIHSLDGGGAERVIAGLASRLADRGHDVDLITLDDGRRNRHELNISVQRIPIDVMSTPIRRVSLFRRLRRLRSAIGSGRYDVVLSFCDATNLLVLLATRWMRQCPPIVVSERSDPAHQSLGRSREWLRNRLYRRAAAVICLSQCVAETLHQRMDVRAIVIPSAIETPTKIDTPLPRQPSLRSTTRLLIAAGRLEREKGMDRLVEAVAILKSRGMMDGWRLRILGEGSQSQPLLDQRDAAGLGNEIEFAGWVQPIWPALQRADLFVLPSRYEGFPSAMLEAMASGLAVVAVDAGGGVRDAIRHGHNAWLISNNTEALAEGLSRLMQDDSLRSKLAAAAPEVCERFAWTPMVDRYEDLLQHVSESVDYNPPK